MGKCWYDEALAAVHGVAPWKPQKGVGYGMARKAVLTIRIGSMGLELFTLRCRGFGNARLLAIVWCTSAKAFIWAGLVQLAETARVGRSLLFCIGRQLEFQFWGR